MIEKLNEAWVESILDKNGMTTGYFEHPTQQEIVDKFNELIEAVNLLTTQDK